jgi:hypothetical protein
MTDPTSRPYADAAALYWDAGWRGILPLPAGRKASPPTGWTGRGGAWPSRPDVQAWRDGHEGAGNLGLRLPEDIIGLDVDNYSGKTGAATLAAATEQYGELPATWRSTSRDDGVSGIRLYRIPPGLAWPGELGPGTEIIQHIHRYVVAWPSVHPEGRVYRWITPDGLTAATAIPSPDDLPTLPDSWVAGVTQGRLFEDLVKADLNDLQITAWLTAHGAGPQCVAVKMTVDRYITERLTGTGSRHDAARDATARLMRMAAEGHTGIIAAVNEIGTAFRGAILADTNRAQDQGEWQRLYIGAIRLAAVDTPSRPPQDPCIVPDVTVLDISTVTVEDAAEATRKRALEAEVAQQRLRRDARRTLDNEDATAAFRVPPSRFSLIEELQVADDPAVYTIDQLLPTNGNVLLAAGFKAGKTTLISHLAACLADGKPFFDNHPVIVPDGRIAIFNYEVGESQYRQWLRDIDIAATPLVSVLHLRGYRLPLLSPHVEDWTVRWLAERDIRVWIVDPFARAATGINENDNTEVGRFLDTLDVIKERAGVTELILSTHTGRQEFEEGQERARGATRLDDWADVRWLLVKDDNDQRYFRATGRDVDVPEMALEFNETTRGLRIAGGTRTANKRTRLVDSIVSVVETNPGISQLRLRAAVRQIVGGISQDALDDGVWDAARSHRIRVEQGEKGKPSRHFPAGPTALNAVVSPELVPE